MKKITPNFLKKFRPNGLVVGIVIGAAAVFTIQKISFNKSMAANLLSGNGSTVCELAAMPASSTTYGIIASEGDYNAAITSYQQAHPADNPSVTWGGMIGKSQLIAIINSLGDANEVNYKFITNTGNNKTAVFFQGGTVNPVTGQAGSAKLFIRSGSVADAFCPPKCN